MFTHLLVNSVCQMLFSITFTSILLVLGLLGMGSYISWPVLIVSLGGLKPYLWWTIQPTLQKSWGVRRERWLLIGSFMDDLTITTTPPTTVQRLSGSTGSWRNSWHMHRVSNLQSTDPLGFEVSMTIEVSLEHRSSYLYRRLSLPYSLSSTALYRSRNKLRFSFSSPRNESITLLAWKHLQYTSFRDTKVSDAGIIVITAKKWKAAEVV